MSAAILWRCCRDPLLPRAHPLDLTPAPPWILSLHLPSPGPMTLHVLYSLLILASFSVASYGTTASAAQSQGKTQTRQRYVQTYAVEIPYANMTANFREWEADLAIMFYAPWCKYCKQLYPSWEQIAAATMANTKDLVVGKFNCEAPAKNVEVCQHLGVDRYPSVYFIGYGAMNQAPRGNPFRSNPQPRVARFTADLYPEAIYDWVRLLAQVSSWQRRWADFKGIFTGQTRSAMKVVSLQKKVGELEKKVDLFGRSLEKYKADELFDSLADHGDPFPLLNELPPDAQNLPLRVCVADMASEYCKYHYDEEAFCHTVQAQCVEQEMEPAACRPATCPFKARGCRVTSACLQTSVIEEYKKELQKTANPAAAAGTASTAAAGGAGAGAGARGAGGGAGAGAGGGVGAGAPKAQADVAYNGNQRVAA